MNIKKQDGGVLLCCGKEDAQCLKNLKKKQITTPSPMISAGKYP
jgi:hypothetical protein